MKNYDYQILCHGLILSPEVKECFIDNVPLPNNFHASVYIPQIFAHVNMYIKYTCRLPDCLTPQFFFNCPSLSLSQAELDLDLEASWSIFLERLAESAKTLFQTETLSLPKVYELFGLDKIEIIENAHSFYLSRDPLTNGPMWSNIFTIQDEWLIDDLRENFNKTHDVIFIKSGNREYGVYQGKHHSINFIQFKHPLYDFYRQLCDYYNCCGDIEKIKTRLTRFLWEITNDTILITPEHLLKFGGIFGIRHCEDVGVHCRLLKLLLKTVFIEYLSSGNFDLRIDSVSMMTDILKPDILLKSSQGETRNLNHLFCSNCGSRSLSTYCENCREFFCSDCFKKLHSKGNRQSHSVKTVLTCSLCKSAPSKLQSTVDFEVYCENCFLTKMTSEYHEHLNLKPIPITYGEEEENEYSIENKENLYICPFINHLGNVYYYDFKNLEIVPPSDGHVDHSSNLWHGYFENEIIATHANLVNIG